MVIYEEIDAEAPPAETDQGEDEEPGIIDVQLGLEPAGLDGEPYNDVVRRRLRRQSGYTLVVCAVTVTVLSIAVATALPLWSAQIRREREEELIFRGLQYAEAIRVFQKRFGRSRRGWKS